MTVINADRRALAAALKNGNAIVERSQIDAYNNVRVSVARGAMSLTFTDGTLWMTTEVPADADSITATTLPSALLSSAVSAMEHARVTIETTQGKATVRSGRARLNMATIAADYYPLPEWPDTAKEAVVPATEIAKALTAASYAAPDMDFGKYIPAVRVSAERVDGRIDFCTADGTRLAAASVVNNSAFCPESINLPLKAARTIASLAAEFDGDVSISMTDRAAVFQIGDWRLMTQLVAAPFVPFQSVMDERCDSPIIFDVKELTRAVGRLSLISDRYSIGVRLDVSADEMTLSLTNQKVGDASEAITVGYEGEPVSVGYSLPFLRDALRTLGDGEGEIHIIAPVMRALILSREDDSAIHAIGPFKI